MRDAKFLIIIVDNFFKTKHIHITDIPPSTTNRCTTDSLATLSVIDGTITTQHSGERTHPHYTQSLSAAEHVNLVLLCLANHEVFVANLCSVLCVWNCIQSYFSLCQLSFLLISISLILFSLNNFTKHCLTLPGYACFTGWDRSRTAFSFFEIISY